MLGQLFSYGLELEVSSPSVFLHLEPELVNLFFETVGGGLKGESEECTELEELMRGSEGRGEEGELVFEGGEEGRREEEATQNGLLICVDFG